MVKNHKNLSNDLCPLQFLALLMVNVQMGLGVMYRRLKVIFDDNSKFIKGRLGVMYRRLKVIFEDDSKFLLDIKLYYYVNSLLNNLNTQNVHCFSI